MNSKRSILLLFGLLISVSIYAQKEETSKVKELGISTRNFDNFGFVFRTGTEKALWRFQTLSFAWNIANVGQNTNPSVQNLQTWLAVGREYRKPLSKRLDFRYGMDLSFGLAYSKSESNGATRKTTSYLPGINAVLGLNYALNERISVGAEWLPGGFYRANRSRNESNDGSVTNNSDHLFGLNWPGGSVLLSMVYRL